MFDDCCHLSRGGSSPWKLSFGLPLLRTLGLIELDQYGDVITSTSFDSYKRGARVDFPQSSRGK